MNKKIVHDALILTAFTLVLGLILGIVYGITKDPIDKANADTARAAYQEVFKDAVSFEAYEYDKDEANQIVADGGYKDIPSVGWVTGYVQAQAKSFYNAGYSAGKNDGYSSGYSAGKDAGYSSGYSKGYAAGVKAASKNKK